MEFNTRPKTVDRDAHCSAPPFTSPPRPSREQEARRKREPLWVDESCASEVERMECTASDVKPDIKPDLAASTSEAATQPVAASASSSPEAQRQIPSRMVRWGTPVVTMQPPPVRPRNTLVRMQRRAAEAAARFDETLGRRATARTRDQPPSPDVDLTASPQQHRKINAARSRLHRQHLRRERGTCTHLRQKPRRQPATPIDDQPATSQQRHKHVTARSRSRRQQSAASALQR